MRAPIALARNLAALLTVALATDAPLLGQTEADPGATAAAGELVTAPHITIDTVGPDGWRMRFGPTNLGTMLESERGRELWQPHIEPLLGIWQQVTGDAAAYDASRQLLLGYGGRIQAALWIDPDDARGRNGPPAKMAFVLHDDGRSELPALAGELRKTLYQAIAGEWTATEWHGQGVDVRHGAELSVTAPILSGGALLIAASNGPDLPAVLTAASDLAKQGKAELRPDSPALRIDFDLASIVKLALAAEDEDERAVMQAFGVTTLETGTFTIGTAGPQVRIDYAQQFSQDDRGLFSAFLPATKRIPSLLQAVGEGTWTVGHFDCGKLYETVLAVLVANDLGDDEKLEREIRSELGIDLADDLLAHMTDDVMFWLPESDDFDQPLERADWALAFRLQDEDAFRAGLFKMLPNARPFMQRERQETFEDVELFRYGNFIGYDLWLAVGRGVFVLSGGRNAETRVEEILTRCKELPAELPAEAQIPAAFAKLQRYLPPGCHGFAVGRATNIISMPTTVWIEILREFLPVPLPRGSVDPDADAERREQLHELLEEHRLLEAKSATGYADQTWRIRIFW